MASLANRFRAPGAYAFRTALLSSTLLCTAPALAQTEIRTAEVDTVDDNNIEISTLGWMPRSEDLSIGEGEFPARLSVQRNGGGWLHQGAADQTYGNFSGTNLDIMIGTPGNIPLDGVKFVDNPSSIKLFIGRTVRDFTDLAKVKWEPHDKKGGYITRAIESGIIVYTYTDRDGGTLRFEVAEDTACGRTGTGPGNFIKCARISTWTTANGVIATFSYTTNSAHRGMYDENRLTSVTNNIGLRLNFGYTLYNDSAPYTDAVYAVTSARASSDISGPCANGPTCSRTASYQYEVVEPASSGVGGLTDLIMTSFTNTMGHQTIYGYFPRTTETGIAARTLKTVTLPTNPSTPAVTLTRSNGYVGHVTKVENAVGDSWTYSQTPSTGARTITRTDSLGHPRKYALNAQGRLASYEDELGRTTGWEYDPYGRVETINFPSGAATEYTYDDRGNVLTTTAKPVSGTGDITTSATYPSTCTNAAKICNKPTSTTDGRSKTTDYTFSNTHGGILTVTRPAAASGVRPQTRYGYTSIGGVYVPSNISTCQTTSSCNGTADESEINIAYGAFGIFPDSEAHRSGNGGLQAVYSYGYDDLINVVSVDGPLSGSEDTTYRRFDRAGRMVGIIEPDPDGTGPRQHRAQRFTYNQANQLRLAELGRVSDPTDTGWAGFVIAQKTAYAVDAVGRVSQIALQRSSVTTEAITQISYDQLGRIDCVAQRMNPAEFATLPSSACTPSTAGSYGPDRISRTIYNDAGQVLQRKVAVGTTAEADELTVTYAADGKVSMVTDGRSRSTSYTYDAHDRLSKIKYPLPTGSGSSETDYQQFLYDENSNVVEFRTRSYALNSASKILFTYDNLNQVTFKDLPYTEPDVAYEYDLLGRLTQVYRAADGNLQQMSYDALGRLTQEIQPFGSASYQYNAAGRRTRLTWNDGFYVSYDNDVAGYVTAIRENGATSGAGVLASYTYDNIGRRTGVTRGNGTSTTYGYDPVSRLSSITQNLAGTANDLTLGFSYNPASQITSTTRSNDLYAWDGHYNRNWTEAVNGLNQLTSQTGTPSSAAAGTLGYDSRANVSAIGSRTFTHSSENLLTNASGGVSVYYDGLQRMVEYDTTVSTRFAYDGVNMISEVANPSGAILRRYVPGPNGDEPIAWYEGSGTTDRRWLHADERGGIVAISNGAGTATGINSYDEYGLPASSNTGRYGYTGQAWLPELGLYYYKARMMNPGVGRFMQTDPIGYDAGMNLYAYVRNDPINFIDPLGLNDCGNQRPELDCLQASYPAQPSPSQSNSEYYYPDLGVANNYGGWGSLSSMANNRARFARMISGISSEQEIKTLREGDLIDCNSNARQLAKFGSETATAFGAATVAFSALGAAPVAGFTGAVSFAADVVTIGAGVYIFATDNDPSVALSGLFGLGGGALGGTLMKGFGGSITRPAPGVMASTRPGKPAIEASKFGFGTAAQEFAPKMCA